MSARSSLDERAAARASQQELTQVDAWTAAAEQAWDAQHRTAATWQTAWSQEYTMRTTAFDPGRPEHLIRRTAWDDALDAQRASAVLDRAAREGVVSPEAGRPPRLGAAPHNGGSTMRWTPSGDDPEETLSITLPAYRQEHARVEAWMTAAAQAWDSCHRTAAHWQAAWIQTYQMGTTAFDPARPGHRLVRQHWDDTLDAQRASAVLDRAAQDGVVPPDVLREYRAAWTEWQAVTHDPTYLAPLRPDLPTYAADEVLRRVRQQHQERRTAPAALGLVWGQLLETGQRAVARHQLERRTGQAHRFAGTGRVSGRLLERVALAGAAYGRVQTRADEVVLVPWTAALAPHRGRTVTVELEATPQVTRVLAEALQRTPASRPTPEGA